MVKAYRSILVHVQVGVYITLQESYNYLSQWMADTNCSYRMTIKKDKTIYVMKMVLVNIKP